MKNRLFPVLIVLVLLIVGFGFYRGWFALSSSNADKGSSKVNVNLTVDRDKIEKDAQTVKTKATELTGSVTDQNTKPVDPLPTNR